MSYNLARSSDCRPQKAGYWNTVLNESDAESSRTGRQPLSHPLHLQPRSLHSSILRVTSRLRRTTPELARLASTTRNHSQSRQNPLHRLERRERSQLSCSKCDKVFKRNYDLNQHISAVHEKNRPFACPLCGQAFAHMGTLSKHHRTVHLGERPFTCKGCHLKFSERGNLNKHISRSATCQAVEESKTSP